MTILNLNANTYGNEFERACGLLWDQSTVNPCQSMQDNKTVTGSHFEGLSDYLDDLSLED